MATVRAKFQVSAINGSQVQLNAVKDDGIPENERFAKATPAGQVFLTIDNPPAMDYFKGRQGKFCYVDFDDAE